MYASYNETRRYQFSSSTDVTRLARQRAKRKFSMGGNRTGYRGRERGRGRGRGVDHGGDNESLIPTPLNQDKSSQMSPQRLPIHSVPSTSQSPKSGGSSSFGPHNGRRNRNSRCGSQNRHDHVTKPVFVKKSELESMHHEVTSLGHEVDSLNVGEGVKGTKVIENCEENNGASASSSEVSQLSKGEDNVESRLDELQMAVEEPELSEEQLRINDQLQEDELLVVESIYGENVSSLDRRKGLRCIQIYIHVEVPDQLPITATINSSNELVTNGKSSNDFQYTFKVQYLPPIVLTCLLTKSYPSHQPPIFTVAVRWLDAMRISSLCSKLDSIWAEQQGKEVLYQWVEWLHGYSLLHLGFNDEITLGPYGSKQGADRRAFSESISPNVDIPSLKNYNDERHHENFNKELHVCDICFSEYAGVDFVRLQCKHFFCWKCMKTYSNMHVKEGTVNHLSCPQSKCTATIPPGLLKCLLGDEAFERWESLLLQKTLDSMSDVSYCPRCETPCIEDEENHAQCQKCFFSFCTLCRERRHLGVECMTPEVKLRVLEMRQNSSQVNEDQKMKERRMIEEIMCMREILDNAKQCPQCGMAIHKTGGCNKMVCGNCGQYFCYLCNQIIDGYDHYRDGNCELFPVEAIHEWEEMNHRQVIGQMQAGIHPERGQRCPSCRQFNAKVDNNNHIYCWACQVHFCYMCKKIVRRASEHYGPRGCKQHTED